LSHSELMGGGWEDRGSLVQLVDGDEFRWKRNNDGTSGHGASGGEVWWWRIDGPWGSLWRQLRGRRRMEGGCRW
jgi:hypothetical protein